MCARFLEHVLGLLQTPYVRRHKHEHNFSTPTAGVTGSWCFSPCHGQTKHFTTSVTNQFKIKIKLLFSLLLLFNIYAHMLLQYSMNSMIIFFFWGFTNTTYYSFSRDYATNFLLNNNFYWIRLSPDPQRWIFFCMN